MSQLFTTQQKKNEQDSFILSILFHLILLLLILIPAFSYLNNKPEPPKFQGVQIALGSPNSERKTPNVSASSTKKAEKSSSKKHSKAAAKAKPVKSVTKKAQPNKATAVNKKVVSKTVQEEAPIVATKKKVVQKKKAQIDHKAEARIKELQAQKEKAALEAAEQAEKRKKEEERIRAEEEAKRKAKEAKQQAAEAEAAKKAQAKSKFSSLIKSTDTSGEPSKGQADGHPDASALEGLSKGRGVVGDGLGDRGLVYAPKISDNTQKEGTVVVKICVNSAGKVISSDFTQKGSTTLDSHLVALAKSSAKKYKFQKSSADRQCGNITIEFKLN